MFAAFERHLDSDVKVAQFAGYIAEHSAYHHGEVSLQGAVVAMAQDFVGSNNINLLVPSGQFGTRLMGGKDAASARVFYVNARADGSHHACSPTSEDNLRRDSRKHATWYHYTTLRRRNNSESRQHHMEN
jgi:hypothetical protein